MYSVLGLTTHLTMILEKWGGKKPLYKGCEPLCSSVLAMNGEFENQPIY